MTRTTKIIAGTLGTLALAGALVVFSPYGRALADGNQPAWGMGWMMNGGNMAAMHNQMTAMFGSDMGAMHQVMAPLMAEMPAIHNQVIGALAAKLDMTPESLQAALDGGKTLTDLAGANKVAPDALKATMVSAMQQALTDLVQAGKVDANVAGRMRDLIPQHAEFCLTQNMAGMQGMMAAMAGMHGAGAGNHYSTVQ